MFQVAFNCSSWERREFCRSFYLVHLIVGRDQRGGITAEITIPLEFNMDFVLSTDVEKFQSKTQMSTSGFCTGKSLGMNNVIKSHLLGTINICTKLNVDGSPPLLFPITYFSVDQTGVQQPTSHWRPWYESGELCHTSLFWSNSVKSILVQQDKSGKKKGPRKVGLWKNKTHHCPH